MATGDTRGTCEVVAEASIDTRCKVALGKRGMAQSPSNTNSVMPRLYEFAVATWEQPAPGGAVEGHKLAKERGSDGPMGTGEALPKSQRNS